MKCSGFHRFVGMPQDHVGVYGGVSGHHAKVGDRSTVAAIIAGTVAGPEEIPEAAHGGSHIALPEFNENVFLPRLQTLAHFAQEGKQGRADAAVVHLFGKSFGQTRGQRKRIHKIEFKAIQIPVPQSVEVKPKQVGPHVGKTGVQRPGSFAGVVGQKFAVEFGFGRAVVAHVENGYAQPRRISEPGKRIWMR